MGKSKNSFKKGHSGNKQKIKDATGGLGQHYGGRRGGCGYENVSIIIIEQVQKGDEDMLAEREAYWQHQLRAYVENGGKAHCFKKEISKY